MRNAENIYSKYAIPMVFIAQDAALIKFGTQEEESSSVKAAGKTHLLWRERYFKAVIRHSPYGLEPYGMW